MNYLTLTVMLALPIVLPNPVAALDHLQLQAHLMVIMFDAINCSNNSFINNNKVYFDVQ